MAHDLDYKDIWERAEWLLAELDEISDPETRRRTVAWALERVRVFTRDDCAKFLRQEILDLDKYVNRSPEYLLEMAARMIEHDEWGLWNDEDEPKAWG